MTTFAPTLAAPLWINRSDLTILRDLAVVLTGDSPLVTDALSRVKIALDMPGQTCPVAVGDLLTVTVTLTADTVALADAAETLWVTSEDVDDITDVTNAVRNVMAAVDYHGLSHDFA